MQKRTSNSAATAVLLGAMAAALSCTSGTSRYVTKTMPSPNGCYVQVWDQPRFTGQSDFINGPREYEQLRDLPGRRNWDKRIRSISLGPAAVAVAWADERFEGRSMLITSDGRERGRFSALSVEVQSLVIRCRRPDGLLADGTGPPDR